MAFLDQNPPTFDNQLEYDKWVADQLIAADADQDRQDDEIQDVKDEYLPLAGGTMVGEVKFAGDIPFNGITVYGPDGKSYNNNQKKVFEAWNGSLYTEPFINLGVEPTLENHATTKKYVDDKGAALDVEIEKLKEDQVRQDEAFALDQKRQDDELADEIQAREERDALHDAEIDTIEYKLESLIGVTFRGTYEFKHEADCDAAFELCIADCLAIDPNDTACRSNCTNNLKLCEQDKVRPGFFEAVDPDDLFDHLTEIIISKADKSNLEIDWSGVLDKDDYLEVDHVMQGQLDKTNYGLYRIMEEPEVSTNAYGEEVYTMKLQFLQGDGVMLENELYEIRGITASEGVNPEELGDFLTKTDAAATYLPLIGGTLTGDLTITNTEATLKLTGSRTNTTNSAATVAFENSQSTTLGYLTYRSYAGKNFFKFNQDVDLGTKTLSGVNRIEMTPGGYIGSSTNPRLTFNNANNGNEGDGLLVVPRPADNRRGFSIRGKDADGTEKDMLFSFTNNGKPDAVNYSGKMDSGSNLVNKAYVDANTTVSLNCGGGARWKKGGLNDSTGTYKYFGIEVAESSSSSAIGSGNVLYLNKLLDSEGVLQDVKNYTPTDNSYVEVYSGNELYFKSQLKPSTYKVASRNPDEIVCDMSSKYPVVANSGSSWSTSTTYKIIVTGLKRNG